LTIIWEAAVRKSYLVNVSPGTEDKGQIFMAKYAFNHDNQSRDFTSAVPSVDFGDI